MNNVVKEKKLLKEKLKKRKKIKLNLMQTGKHV